MNTQRRLVLVIGAMLLSWLGVGCAGPPRTWKTLYQDGTGKEFEVKAWDRDEVDRVSAELVDATFQLTPWLRSEAKSRGGSTYFYSPWVMWSIAYRDAWVSMAVLNSEAHSFRIALATHPSEAGTRDCLKRVLIAWNAAERDLAVCDLRKATDAGAAHVRATVHRLRSSYALGGSK